MIGVPLLQTSRMETHYVESGPEDGVPVVLLHGNLSTGRFFTHLFDGAPERYRLIAPDMRGFGDSEPLPIDATRGLRDWADDTHALLEALGIERPPHLAGWSTGGAAIAAYARERPVASLTFIDPVSPYGYGGTHADGTPCFPDWAGTGGGIGNPEFAARIEAERPLRARATPRRATCCAAPTGRRATRSRASRSCSTRCSSRSPATTATPATPRRRRTGRAWRPARAGSSTRCRASTATGATSSTSTPSRRSCGPTAREDIVVADGSPWEMGTLGQLGVVPGWPGEEAFPPQAMVFQIRSVLQRYGERGGRVVMELFEGSGHFPPIDAAERWSATFFEFLSSAE